MYKAEVQKQFFEQSKAFLSSPAKLEQIEELRDLLRFHEWKYYVESSPVLSDFEYDQLYKSLEELELQFPLLITPDSPTQRVAKDLTTDFEKVKHLTPMLSLGNSYNQEDLEDFAQSIVKLTGSEDLSFAVEPKFDGGSIALVYENDHLIRSATRGDGAFGEKMTANAKAIKSIPLKAAFSKYGIARAELRGEAVIRKDKFDAVNKQRAANQQVLFANPRNAATGGLRMKDANETAKRGIDVFVFQLSYAVDSEDNDILGTFDTHSACIAMLKDLGFKVPNAEFGVYKTAAEVAKHCTDWEAKREAYPFEIDGMVIKVDAFALQEIAGYTQHHPRWAIAYKFKAKQATSTLETVEYQVGKTGSVTPVAKITPVALAGVTVSSISLHNEEFIQSKDIRLGDTVLVERAGDVIPYIVKSLDELRTGEEEPIVFPTECPSCSHALTKTEDEAKWRCPNPLCEAQAIQRMIFHVSKDAMNIDGFGRSYIERFYELGWLKDISDIYNLDYEAIANLEGFGERSATKLRTSIEQAKNNPIYRVLNSLSVYHLGRKASRVLAERIKHVMDLKDWEEEDFTSIHDVGPILAREVSAFFQLEENVMILEKMESYGVNMHQTKDDEPIVLAEDAPFSGKTILFTGSLQRMTRKEAQAKATLAGAKNISGVSSKLDYLVVGEKAGSKLKKAEALGTVEILTEDEFLSKVDDE